MQTKLPLIPLAIRYTMIHIYFGYIKYWRRSSSVFRSCSGDGWCSPYLHQGNGTRFCTEILLWKDMWSWSPTMWTRRYKSSIGVAFLSPFCNLTLQKSGMSWYFRATLWVADHMISHADVDLEEFWHLWYLLIVYLDIFGLMLGDSRNCRLIQLRLNALKPHWHLGELIFALKQRVSLSPSSRSSEIACTFTKIWVWINTY